jgi:hypothetical protein
MSQVDRDLQDWRSQEARLFGVVSAFTQLIKPLSNCPGLFEAKQLAFIEKIDAPDLSPHDILILERDPFISPRNLDTRSGLAKGRRHRVIRMKN